MNAELAAYITRLCELSGHTTWIKKDLILVEPGEDFIYDAFTMVKEYYAYGQVDKYSFGGADFSSASEPVNFSVYGGLEVGGDSVGVGGGELGEGLFPVGGGASLDEACGGCSFVGGFAGVCEALGGSFVFDVADGEP